MIPWFEITTLHIGPIPIQVWGFWVAFGIGVGVYLLLKRAAYYGCDKKTTEHIYDSILWLIIGGIIGARVFYILFYDPLLLTTSPLELFAIWKGGLSSFGGMVGGIFGFLLWRYRIKKSGSSINLSITKLFDMYAYATIFAWMVGRIGCVFIHDHPGMECNCLLAFDWPGGPRLDMAFLEIIGLLPLAIIFFLHKKIRHKDGWFLSIFLGYYGILRFILGFFRATDLDYAEPRFLALTPGQYFGIVMACVGLYMAKKRGFFTKK